MNFVGACRASQHLMNLESFNIFKIYWFAIKLGDDSAGKLLQFVDLNVHSNLSEVPTLKPVLNVDFGRWGS